MSQRKSVQRSALPRSGYRYGRGRGRRRWRLLIIQCGLSLGVLDKNWYLWEVETFSSDANGTREPKDYQVPNTAV